MTADQDVFNQSNGIAPGDPTGFSQFAMVRGRARKVLGDVIGKLPFTRSWGNVNVVATPSDYDHGTLTAEQIAWRYVDSTGAVMDFGDMQLIKWEYFLLTADPKILTQAINNAKTLRKWPTGYTGIAPFEANT